jgi:hypothetical protein
MTGRMIAPAAQMMSLVLDPARVQKKTISDDRQHEEEGNHIGARPERVTIPMSISKHGIPASIHALFPYKNPITEATRCFGGIAMHICTWSGIECPSTI